ncbi:LysR substrate-binding domain-containing protein [Acidaminobacterium chupaoyuni]
MTLRHMRIFIQVYQTQNITKAAALLHMTQPAVTRSIQEIEHHYGVRLFERINHRLSVTEMGKLLYQQAVHIVDSFDSLEKGLYQGDSFGVLRVGATITIGNHALPQLLVRFQQQYPHVRVECMILNAGALQAALAQNKLDIALIESTIDDPDLCYQVFSHDQLRLITPPDHPLLQKDRVLLNDLVAYPLLMREEGSAGRTFLEHVFASRGLPLRPATVSISTHAILKAVHYGLGISLLPHQLVEEDIKNGNVLTKDIADVDLSRQHMIVWHRNKYLSPMLQAFMALCEAAPPEADLGE